MLKVFSAPPGKKSPGLALVTEADYFPVLMSLLGAATKQIDLMAFSFVVGSEAGQLYFESLPFKVMEKLKALKKQRGDKIRVRVFLEGARDTAGKNRVTAAHLAKAGIEVRLGATHAKAFGVDGRYTLLGSTNLTGQSLTKNFETNLLLDSAPTARQFNRYFEHYWQGGGHGAVALKAPLLADGAFKPALIKAIAKAKKSISFSIYFFYQKEIEKALIDAHRRGVRITGLVHNHQKFALADVKRTRATVARLTTQGLKGIYFSSPATFTHSKYLVADGKQLLLSTGNWLDRDTTTHPQLTADIAHGTLCRSLEKHLRATVKEING